MAITHVGTTTIVFGSTSAISPTYPASIVAGDMMILCHVAKLSSNTINTPSGWTQIDQQALGTGTDGVGTGLVKVAAFYKVAAGGESGSVSSNTATAANVQGATISVWRSATGWFAPLISTFGQDTTHGTAWSATGGAGLDLRASDVLFACVGATANTNLGSTNMTATGATMSALTERQEAGSATGNAIRLQASDVTVNSGSSNSAPVHTATATVNTSGGLIFVRLREAARPVPRIVGNSAPVTRSYNW